ncbi:MOSC domain-containing protein [Methylobacterium sp. J-088]|uniref:MOSC domain-containing protein n=1 Tax=Methylobacterium sp. J-088 TaxID=2836664 RepID=UPI001FBAC193|nr:MOSC N-terminal beta barrel domain-containing protein [Methylobacterium sp. J-088]MCJ2061795.1 MOSC domain-containing protein [Methylobacterium sp. J-088]
MTDAIHVTALYRYPVKGLSPEPVERVDLETSGFFPGDRLYAIENGPSGFNAVAPRHQPKTKYLMLMRDEALARLRTRFDDATATLTVEGCGDPQSFRLDTEAGRDGLADLMRRFVPESLRGEPKVLEAPPQYRFTDSPTGYVSLINRASVAAVEDYIGAPVDPLRFRGNLLIEGLAAFAELEMVGQVIEAPSGLRLKITKRTVRCAATNVDPTSGVRDCDIPWTLDARLGHRDLGVYVEVIAGGAIARGDPLRPVG